MKAYFWRMGIYLLLGIVGFTFFLPANLFAQRGKEVDYKLLRRDIEVMVGVINTMLKETRVVEEEREQLYYVSSRVSECKGFHLNDYGIVFTLNLPLRYGSMIFELGETIALRMEGLTRREREKKAQEHETQEQETKKTAEEMVEERLAKFKDQLIDIMGNYGDFIKQVPATGYITIVVFYGDSDSFRGISKRMILTIKRGDISEYRDGKLSMEEFKRRVKSTEY